MVRQAFPLRATDGTEQQRGAVLHALDGVVGHRHADLVERCAAGEVFRESEGVAELRPDGLHHAHALDADLWTDAVAVDDRDGVAAHGKSCS